MSSFPIAEVTAYQERIRKSAIGDWDQEDVLISNYTAQAIIASKGFPQLCPYCSAYDNSDGAHPLDHKFNSLSLHIWAHHPASQTALVAEVQAAIRDTLGALTEITSAGAAHARDHVPSPDSLLLGDPAEVSRDPSPTSSLDGGGSGGKLETARAGGERDTAAPRGTPSSPPLLLSPPRAPSPPSTTPLRRPVGAALIAYLEAHRQQTLHRKERLLNEAFSSLTVGTSAGPSSSRSRRPPRSGPPPTLIRLTKEAETQTPHHPSGAEKRKKRKARIAAQFGAGEARDGLASSTL